MWLDDHGGEFSVELDSTCAMSDCRVHCSNFNDATFFSNTITRGIKNGTVFKSELFTTSDGYVFVNAVNSYQKFSDPWLMISDANFIANPNDPRVLLSGPVNMLGDSQKARHYLGRDTYVAPDGVIWLGTVSIRSGTGSPEGVVTAVRGSKFYDKTGGAGTCEYTKESGAGNTGWVAK